MAGEEIAVSQDLESADAGWPKPSAGEAALDGGPVTVPLVGGCC